MIPAILSGIAAKLAGLGLAAKVGTGIAAATIATAGVATVAPVINPGAPAGIEIQVPSVPAPEADLGLKVAADANSGQANAGAQAGLDTARQTPAAANVPASVPVVTRPAPAAAAQKGLDVARQTPAGDRVPAVVPGPPAVVPGPPASVPAVAPPANLPPAAAAGATGIDAATQTPGGQHLPPFVKGMVGRSN